MLSVLLDFRQCPPSVYIGLGHLRFSGEYATQYRPTPESVHTLFLYSRECVWILLSNSVQMWTLWRQTLLCVLWVPLDFGKCAHSVLYSCEWARTQCCYTLGSTRSMYLDSLLNERALGPVRLCGKCVLNAVRCHSGYIYSVLLEQSHKVGILLIAGTCWDLQQFQPLYSSLDFSFCPKALAGSFRKGRLRRPAEFCLRCVAIRLLMRSMTASETASRRRKRKSAQVGALPTVWGRELHCALFRN